MVAASVSYGCWRFSVAVRLSKSIVCETAAAISLGIVDLQGRLADDRLILVLKWLRPVRRQIDNFADDLFIEDKSAILPIDAAIQSNLREATTRTLALLTPREERVLRMRFGIGMNTDHTLEEVGQQFSVTRERIRQIEAKALRKLKHPSRSRILRSFLHD